MASVSKRRWTYNGIVKEGWVVRYLDPATGKRPSKKCESKKEADAFKRKVERDIEDGRHISPENEKTFADVAARYADHLEARLADRAIGRSHYLRERSAIQKWGVPAICQKKFSVITGDDCIRLYRTMVAGGLSHKTAESYLYAMRQMEKWARAPSRRWTRGDAFGEAMSEIKVPPVAPVRTFTAEQVVRLLSQVSQRRPKGHVRHVVFMECVVGLAALCGMRMGEIMALAPGDIDLENRSIRVGHNITRWRERKDTKTRSGKRVVSFPERLVKPLSSWLTEHAVPNAAGLLFSKADGSILAHSSVRASWLALLDRCGMGATDGNHYHFHALRHFHASWLLRNNMPPADVARLMGHSHAGITLRIYTHAMLDLDNARQHIDRTTMLLPDATAPQMALSA